MQKRILLHGSNLHRNDFSSYSSVKQTKTLHFPGWVSFQSILNLLPHDRRAHFLDRFQIDRLLHFFEIRPFLQSIEKFGLLGLNGAIRILRVLTLFFYNPFEVGTRELVYYLAHA